MDVSSQFESVPIIGTKQFSWVFICEWALALVTTLFVIFFFNRFCGSIFSLTFRWYLWRRHRIRIKVQSVQLSLLGGRLFFKNLSYVGSNEVVLALQGNFTWRYWLHRRRMSKLDAHNRGDEKQADEAIPTRLVMKVDGLEWFVFNRSAAYDSLFQYVNDHHNHHQSRYGENHSTSSSNSTHYASTAKSPFSPGNNDSKEAQGGHPEAVSNDITLFEQMFLRLMPFQVRCNKGAMVLGNRTTPSVLVLHFSSSTTTIDVAPTKNPLDKYKMSYDLHMQKPILEMKSNIDYEGPKNTTTLVTKKSRDSKKNNSHAWYKAATRRTLRAFDKLLLSKLREKESMSKNNKNTTSSNDDSWERSQWKGLRRYLSNQAEDGYNENTGNDSNDFNELVEEYGKYSTLIDASEATISYYYDIPGLVPSTSNTENTGRSSGDGPDIGNGGAAPEWGINMSFTNSTTHYGPWTDRQRVILQSMLFPRYCVNATPTQRLQPGQPRCYTEMKLFVEFHGDSIIRVPMREFSKNAQFFAKYKENPNAHSLRPFGWIEAKFKDLSSISFNAGMVVDTNGSQNHFQLDLRYPELRSSVNHGLLFSADSHQFTGKVDYPIQWNGLQNWTFNNLSRSVKTFFLREHVTLLIDLTKDFGAGPPSSYDQYTPARYHVNWDIEDFAIYLNVNDQNIINNPSDFEDNTFVAAKGEQLAVSIEIPLEQIETVRNEVSFEISVRSTFLTSPSPSKKEKET